MTGRRSACHVPQPAYDETRRRAIGGEVLHLTLPNPWNFKRLGEQWGTYDAEISEEQVASDLAPMLRR